MLIFENVSFGYTAEKPVFENFNLTIREGLFFGITGKNGCGKSTLLKLASGLLIPESGRILHNGIVLSDRKELCRQIGLVFQFPERQLFEETVFKDICFGPLNLGFDVDSAGKQALKAMTLCGLDDSYCNRSPFELSDGEKRLVAIAGVLAMDSRIVALDEPSAGLDMEMHSKIMEILNNLNDNGKTIIMVSHEREDLNYCSEIIDLGA